ncbi:unnamed protein product [Orchesella dallaii]|uniref:Uncharacterized protein n=1 Tax=Orchesella dallaii TaxID=48710 RepID=A0ABP1RGD7_9HEXA
MFTHLTARLSPNFPSDFSYIILTTSMDVISTKDGSLEIFLRNHPSNYNGTSQLEEVMLTKEQMPKVYVPILTAFNIAGAHGLLIRTLSKFEELKCKVLEGSGEATKVMSTKSRFETFVLIYETSGYVASSFAIFSKRNVIDSNNNKFAYMIIYSTKFRRSFENSLSNFLANLDASGLKKRLLCNYKWFREFNEMCRISREMGFGNRRNLYFMLSQTSKLSYNFRVKDEIAPFKFEDAALIFIAWLTIIGTALIYLVLELVNENLKYYVML